MDASIKISIIIPVYNTEQYLRQCLDSALGQSLKDIEIIVVNDCSPGNCREIVEEYQKNDARIKYIEHETNKGSYIARQTGILAASGEFTRFLDSDDWLDPDTCSITYDALKKEGADMLYHSVEYHYETPDKPWTPPIPSNGYEVLTNSELLNQIYDYHYTWDPRTKSHATCCFTFTTSTIQRALKEWNIQKYLTMYEDFLANVCYICHSHKCVCIDKKLYQYRIGSGISYVKITPELLVKKFHFIRFIFKKAEEICRSKNLWADNYQYRESLECLHIFEILKWSDPQYLKKTFSLLKHEDVAAFASAYLSVKKYYLRERLVSLSKKPKRFHAIGIKDSMKGIKNSIIGIFFHMISLFLSIVNKFLEIIGVGKKW